MRISSMALRETRLTAALVLLIVAAAQAGPADIPEAAETPKAEVVVSGAGIQGRTFAAADLAALPRVTVQADDHGVTGEFEGVALSTLLTEAGAPLGAQLRGEKLTLVLAVDAADGYRALYALPELDPAWNDRMVLLADRRDGKPLGEFEGPLRIVAVGEKKQGRWVRQVTALTLIALPSDRPRVRPAGHGHE